MKWKNFFFFFFKLDSGFGHNYRENGGAISHKNGGLGLLINNFGCTTHAFLLLAHDDGDKFKKKIKRATYYDRKKKKIFFFYFFHKLACENVCICVYIYRESYIFGRVLELVIEFGN